MSILNGSSNIPAIFFTSFPDPLQIPPPPRRIVSVPPAVDPVGFAGIDGGVEFGDTEQVGKGSLGAEKIEESLKILREFYFK